MSLGIGKALKSSLKFKRQWELEKNIAEDLK